MEGIQYIYIYAYIEVISLIARIWNSPRLILRNDNSLVITSLSRRIATVAIPYFWLEIFSDAFSPVSASCVPSRHRSARWQSHDNQRRIVIGNPISLPNCTPNRFAGTNGNFLHVAYVIYFHVPELNTQDLCLCGNSQCLLCDLRKFRRLSVMSLIRIQHLTPSVTTWFSSTSYVY